MKTVDLKDEYRTETDEDVYATMENYGAYTDKYVKWLESKLKNNEVLDLVSQQRELFIKFLEFGRDRHYTPLTQCSIIDMVEDFELKQ